MRQQVEQMAQSEQPARQQGQILALFALVLTILLGMAGVAIDIAHARSVASDIQRAAEAGALAGVVFLPGNVPLAETQALTVTTQNGYTGTSTANPCPGAANTVCIGFNANPVQRQLQETITVQVPTFFLKVLGFNTIAVSKSATASYDDPIPLGAPDHMLGFAPFPTQAISSTVKFGQGFYLENRGPYTGLEHGDAFSPYFETVNGDHLLINSKPDLSGTYSAETATVDERTCASYVSGSATTACVDSNNKTVYLVNNSSYNQENQNNPPGTTGYNYVFSLPANSPPVLLKVLNVFDECTWRNHYNGITVYGPSGLAAGVSPSAIPVSTEKIDQCDSPYFGIGSGSTHPTAKTFSPTSLQFTLYTPSLHLADNTAPLSPTTNVSGLITDPLGNWTVNLGTHAGGTLANSNSQVFGADPATTAAAAHGFQWLTLASVQNTGAQPEYIRLTVASVQNADGTFGQGGHNFALAICKNDTTTIGDPTVSSAFASAFQGTSTSNFYTSPAGVATSYDTGCADPNWPHNGDGYGCPNVNGNPDYSCYQVSARVAFCLETLKPAGGPAFIPIAAIDNSYAGSDLTLKLFDSGDIGNGTNVIKILSPTNDPATLGSCSTNCTAAIHLDISAPANTGYGPAGQGRDPMASWWTTDYNATAYPNNNGPINPPLTSAGTTAGVYPANNTYHTRPGGAVDANIFGNDVWLNMHILLPTSYNPLPTNEWWKVYYNATASEDDTTTWEVQSGSSPVHLISET